MLCKWPQLDALHQDPRSHLEATQPGHALPLVPSHPPSATFGMSSSLLQTPSCKAALQQMRSSVLHGEERMFHHSFHYKLPFPLTPALLCSPKDHCKLTRNHNGLFEGLISSLFEEKPGGYFNFHTHLKNVDVVGCAVRHEHSKDLGLRRETTFKY